MADQGFRRPKRLYFDQVGADVNSPIDAPKRPRRLYKAKNVTIETDGSLTTRPGFANLYAGLVVAGQTPCHSERRISDDSSGAWARVIGTGTHLAVELSSAAGTTTSIDTGYSGKPFTYGAWRPSESAKLHLYIGDSSRMRKVDTAGNDKQIGLPAPTTPPTVELSTPEWREIGNMEDHNVWTQGGVATAPSSPARVNTTLEATSGAVYDSGSTGWACFRPVDISNIGPGSLLDYITSGPTTGTMRVAEVHRAGAATTIATIVYESGTSGICTIQPANAVIEFVRNALVKLDNPISGITEYVRILAVVPGVNGGRCIRVRTASQFAATNALQAVNSFRAFNSDGATSGDTITQDSIQTIINTAGVGTLTQTTSVDLTVFGSSSNAKPVYDDDYFGLSIKASDWSVVTNIRVLASLDTTYTGNYYWRTIEQSVLVAAAKNTQTTGEVRRRERQQAVPREQIFFKEFNPEAPPEGVVEYPIDVISPELATGGPSPVKPSGETGTGDNQWSEIRWKRRDFQRAGTDQSKGWKDVSSLRVEITCTAAVTINVSSLHVSGGYEPNIGDLGAPYQYRYRGRDSATGVVSDYSPACLEQVIAYRSALTVTLTQHPSTEADKLDIERWGGTQARWLLVGTVANSASPTFTDNLSDLAATANVARSDYRVLQPWVRFGDPKSGTATTVAGNLVRDNGSNVLSTSMVPGTPITVNGIATSIRRMVGSSATTNTWELADSIGSATNVAWEMPVQVLAGQPLAAIWRHDTGAGSVMFACDGIYLRWSIGNNPDGTRSSHYLEMTEANDPTVMGFSYNGRCGVFTTRRLFWITGDPTNGFRADEVPNGKGLFDRYALAVGNRVAWLAKDGIYETSGGAPDNITYGDLGPLFANEEGGGAPTSVNGIRAPKISSSESGNLRLDYADDGSLMFLYRDQSANRACLRYVPQREGWWYYEFGKPLVFVHSEDGTGIRNLVAGDADGKLHLVGGSAAPVIDDGTSLSWEAQTFAEDFGDARPNKRIGDLEVDANPRSQTINVELGLNNHTSTTNLGTITGASQTQKLFDLSSGDGLRGRNVSLRLHGTVASGSRPKLFSWEPSVQDYPADTILRASTKQDAGYAGDKYMQGIVIHADTYNQPKVLAIKKDDGTTIDTITIQHNGERRESYAFSTTDDNTRIARLVWISTADSDPWTLIDWEWKFNREPPAAKYWEIQYTGVDADDYFHVFQILLALRSTASVTLKTYADNTLIATNTIASTSGNLSKTAPIVLPAQMTKLVKWRLESSADFRLYQRDCAIWTMQDGGGDYSMLRPFGDVHRDRGAEI